MAARWLIGKLYEYVPPGGIACRGWPSLGWSTIMPCQCVIVSWDSPFTSWTCAVAPRDARMVGPGREPLYAHTEDDLPPPRLTVAGASLTVSPLGDTVGGT